MIYTIYFGDVYRLKINCFLHELISLFELFSCGKIIINSIVSMNNTILSITPQEQHRAPKALKFNFMVIFFFLAFLIKKELIIQFLSNVIIKTTKNNRLCLFFYI